jgi:hypothetical protein
MKIFVLCLLTLCSNPSWGDARLAPTARRVNQLLKFIANYGSIRNLGLYGLISPRCARYLTFSDAHSCKAAVKRQIEILDYDIIFTNKHHKQIPARDAWTPEAFVFVAFKKTLVNTLSDPRTEKYLELIKEGLNGYLIGATPNFNIWELTLEYYGHPLIAAKTLAAIFQDTSEVKLHLAYLERSKVRGRGPYENNRERLSQLIDMITVVLDYRENSYRELFYPKALQGELYRNVYHFYVPLFLSMTLKAEGRDFKDAHRAPMLLTMTYEFVTSAQDYRYLLADPLWLPANSSSIKDIHAAYVGARFGLEKSTPSNTFSLIKEAFTRSTQVAADFLLHLAN